MFLRTKIIVLNNYFLIKEIHVGKYGSTKGELTLKIKLGIVNVTKEVSIIVKGFEIEAYLASIKIQKVETITKKAADMTKKAMNDVGNTELDAKSAKINSSKTEDSATSE